MSGARLVGLKNWEGKLASIYAEALPDQCPPVDAADEAIDEVYRLVANPTPTSVDFESKAARGIPLGANASPCSWASCSLSKKARSLLKYNRLRQELPYLARLTIPISFDIDRYDDPSITNQEKSIIKESFDRSWDGGGSYVAFYRDVANDNDYHAPLRVSGIQYNSPGHVKIHARSEPFKNVLNILQYYSDNELKVRKAYNALGAFMSVNKLKRKGASNALLTESVKKSLELKCQDLSNHIPGISYDTLKEMTGGNSLVAAKVIASIFRRIEKLFRFFDEGRVSHSKLTLENSDVET